MKKIVIKELFDFCLSEQQGYELRNKIIKCIEEGEQNIELDFSGISLFATTFFNASLAYLFINLTPTKYEELIQISNLSANGQIIYTQSINNAKQKLEKYDSRIDEIIKDINT